MAALTALAEQTVGEAEFPGSVVHVPAAVGWEDLVDSGGPRGLGAVVDEVVPGVALAELVPVEGVKLRGPEGRRGAVEKVGEEAADGVEELGTGKGRQK